MPLIFRNFNKLICEIHKQAHPLHLLNHLFHDQTNLSYKTVVSLPLKQRQQDMAQLTIDKTRDVNRLYNLYLNDCKVLREELNKTPCGLVGVTNPTSYQERVDKIIAQLDGLPEFDRLKGLKAIEKEFYTIFEELSHAAAQAHYTSRASSNSGGQSQAQIGTEELLNKIAPALSQTASRADILTATTAIQEWQRVYNSLPETEAWALHDLLNTGVPGSQSSAKDALKILAKNPPSVGIKDTFEYLLADCAETLKDKLQLTEENDLSPNFDFLSFGTPTIPAPPPPPPLDNPKPDSKFRGRKYFPDDPDGLVVTIGDTNSSSGRSAMSQGRTTTDQESLHGPINFGLERTGAALQCEHLSRYLLEYMPEEFCVTPTDPNSFPQSPDGLQVLSHGLIAPRVGDDDDDSDTESIMSDLTEDSSFEMPGTQDDWQIQYTEYADNKNNIVLINNEIQGDIAKNQLETVLNHQVGYLQSLTPEKKVSDEFVFRLEFKSQEHFESYQKNNKLYYMLESFSESHKDFSIKVVIKNDQRPGKEAVTRYASFEELFAQTQHNRKKDHPANLHQGSTSQASLQTTSTIKTTLSNYRK